DGGLATLSPNRHSAQYFYIELDGELVSLYGQAQYTSLASAQDDTPPSTVPDRLNAHGKLIGRIIFKKSDATASLIESVFDTSFSTTLVTDHGNLSGLTDDDHTQYHTDARGDARYYTETELDAGQLDNRYYTETELDAGQLDNRYHTEAEITTISGDLATQINALTHDGFADYVTNEHIDWTGDAGADNIHDNNIVSSSVTQHEGDIDHDALTNFVTNEHIDHTSVSITASGILSGGGTIVATRQIGLVNSDIDHDALTNYAADEHFTEASIDHGSIAGLSDNDHTQYAQIAAAESITGVWSFGAVQVNFANGTIYKIEADGDAVFKEMILQGGKLTLNNQGAGADPFFTCNSPLDIVDLTGDLRVSEDYIFKSGTAFEGLLSHNI
ncbi:hypothetical protein LCGC14_2901760, partial [marine sediment metagenome]